MSATGLASFDRTVQTTNEWLNEVAGELGWEDRQRAYHALRCVLHALRDRLTVDEAANLAAQLPMLLRGVYYEGWKPAATPSRERMIEEFLDHVERNLDRDFTADLGAETEDVIRAVFAVLARRVEEGQAGHVRDMLPAEVRQLWPGETAHAAAASGRPR